VETNIELLQSISFSQKAEFKLVNVLLQTIVDEYEYSTRRALSSYPRLNVEEKTKAIIKLSSLLLDPESINLRLNSFESFERFLRAAGKRDHFVHQFEVFLLGWSILNHHFTLSNMTIELKEKFRWWLIASLSHDIGYPVSSVITIMEKLSALYDNENTFEISKVLGDACDLLKEKKTHSPLVNVSQNACLIVENAIDSIIQDTESTKKLSKKLHQEYDHGYISSLLMIDNLFTEDQQGTIEDPYVRWATQAIALHNLSHDRYFEIINKISINENPFAYVLFITDCLQEWERPNNIDFDYPTFMLDDFKVDKQNNIRIKFILKHRHWSKNLVEEQLKYIKGKEERLHCLKDDIAFKINIEYACTNSDLNEKNITIPKDS